MLEWSKAVEKLFILLCLYSPGSYFPWQYLGLQPTWWFLDKSPRWISLLLASKLHRFAFPYKVSSGHCGMWFCITLGRQALFLPLQWSHVFWKHGQSSCLYFRDEWMLHLLKCNSGVVEGDDRVEIFCDFWWNKWTYLCQKILTFFSLFLSQAKAPVRAFHFSIFKNKWSPFSVIKK